MMLNSSSSYGGGPSPILLHQGQGHAQTTMDFQSPPESTAAATGVTTITLLVRHLPEGIPQDTLFRLFSHYCASSVRPCTAAGRLRNCAFVDFPTEALASQAHSQLHRLRFLGKVLTVERATNPPSSHNNTNHNINNQQHGEFAKEFSSLPASLIKDAPSAANQPLTKGGIQSVREEPIAPTLGVDYSFPPHLEYAYPPPDGNILTNIVNALIAVPRFYTQVLHLMNKMNIPAPFRMALPTPPLPSSVPAPPPPLPSAVIAKPPLADLSSDESELESSEEGDNDEDKNTLVRTPSDIKHGRKRPRREPIVGPAVDKDVAHETVGLRPASLVPKEMPMIKKKNTVLQIKLVTKPVQNETMGDAEMNESGEPGIDGLELKPFATSEDIESGKLPPEEILSLPMFKNYTAGNPATVLYIKNLAKDVVNDDFYFIFGSLFGTVEAAKSGLSIKLMQEGRMRGQAFVTFASVDLAHRALNLVNGYVLKGKPMIIQFGRNPAAGKPH